MKNLISLLLVLVVSACFENEPPIETNGKQSAIEVKSQTQTIDLAPLGQSLSKSQVRTKPRSLNNSNHNSTHDSTHDTPKLRKVAALYAAKLSDAQVEDIGLVTKILADDNRGSRHQKFLAKVASGQTLLFAHNIDLAPRINRLEIGDKIEFRGEYEYNPKGGVVHWTHHDPQGKHFAGWLKHNGQIYE